MQNSFIMKVLEYKIKVIMNFMVNAFYAIP